MTSLEPIRHRWPKYRTNLRNPTRSEDRNRRSAR